MGDYHDHHLKKVLLLADVYEKFINACLYIFINTLSWIRSLSLF